MAYSLHYKLNDFQKQQKRKKTDANLLLTPEETTQLIRYLPQDEDTLSKYLSADKIKCYGTDLLKVLESHPRNQSAFTNALLEMQAFANGGDIGMYLLNKVYRRILEEFKMMGEINELFHVLNFYTHHTTGELRRKNYTKHTDDYEETADRSSKRARLSSVTPTSNSSSQDY